ncbi:CsbD family protein [Streptomyces beijiangensis]|uniref:CsbD family protein n=1 Tax=Streptomyces beijiangensis TaxID=163361 RepID=A0A939JL45_9ACTN|nr:CsbD family protein [Streptomyces beijiangensis]MBO0516005.1 CsbD family protein [Streptomyces beijiangensis]
MSFGRTMKHKAQEYQGRITERLGRRTGNRSLQRQGTADRTAGGLKQSGDRIRRAFKR